MPGPKRPRGWSKKDVRMEGHIEQSELKAGKSAGTAKSIGMATVNQYKAKKKK